MWTDYWVWVWLHSRRMFNFFSMLYQNKIVFYVLHIYGIHRFSWYNLIFHHLYVNNKKKPHLKAALNWLIWKRSNWISGKLFGAKEKKISFFSWKDKNLQRSWFCNYLENEKIGLTGCRLVVLCSQTWWKIWKFEHYLLKKKCFQMHLIGACYMENNSI